MLHFVFESTFSKDKYMAVFFATKLESITRVFREVCVGFSCKFFLRERYGIASAGLLLQKLNVYARASHLNTLKGKFK